MGIAISEVSNCVFLDIGAPVSALQELKVSLRAKQGPVRKGWTSFSGLASGIANWYLLSSTRVTEPSLGPALHSS